MCTANFRARFQQFHDDLLTIGDCTSPTRFRYSPKGLLNLPLAGSATLQLSLKDLPKSEVFSGYHKTSDRLECRQFVALIPPRVSV